MNHKYRTSIFLTCVLAALGGAAAFISLKQHTLLSWGLQTGKSFCNISDRVNCDAINSSPWAEIWGLPLASIGLWFYALLFFINAFSFNQVEEKKGKALDLNFALSGFSVLLSAYLFYLSEFVIGSLCILCLSMYAVNVLIFLLAIFSRKLPSGTKLQNALSALWELPKIPFVAWIILSLGLVYTLPNFFLFDALVTKKIQAPGSDQTLRGWKEQPKSEIKLDLNGGLYQDFLKGNPSAPVIIVEFSDLKCPACKKFHSTAKEILSEFPGKVALVFKNYPLDMECNSDLQQQIHKNACKTAEIARCAGEQDRFWDALDYLFSQDDPEHDLDLTVMGGALGLDQQALEQCISSTRHLEKIKSDIKQGSQLKVLGTPWVFVNGKRLEAHSKQTLGEVIREILK